MCVTMVNGTLLHYSSLTMDNIKKQSYCQGDDLAMVGGSLTHYQS